MNGRITKLLHSYARSAGIAFTLAKKEWHATPRDRRGAVRAEMESNLWRRQLQDFRKRTGLSEKEAAAKLNVPYETWRKWESMQMTPARFVQIALGTIMRNYDPEKKINPEWEKAEFGFVEPNLTPINVGPKATSQPAVVHRTNPGLKRLAVATVALLSQPRAVAAGQTNSPKS